MKTAANRIQSISIENFKNISHGSIKFSDYGKKNENPEVNIMGIYGQNGSGKTALIDAIEIISNLIMGSLLPIDLYRYIKYNETTAKLKIELYIKNRRFHGKIIYSVSLCRETQNYAYVSKETISVSEKRNGQWSKMTPIISYNATNENVFAPKNKYEKVISYNPNNIINLKVAQSLSQRYDEEKKEPVVTSFVFSKVAKNIWAESLKNDIVNVVIQELYNFFNTNFMLIDNSLFGAISSNNQAIPLGIHSEFNRNSNEKLQITGWLPVQIIGETTAPEEMYPYYEKFINKLNQVLPMIIPYTTISIASINRKMQEDGTPLVGFELATERNNCTVPLKYESAGIKKIISILGNLIAMYNEPSYCLLIDELDSGVFEYLLGQLLLVLKSDAQGQLIFTSHNLHVLEVLDTKSLIFTSSNTDNCFVPLKYVKANNNKRDLYFRMLALYPEEKLYDSTNQYEISHAFRLAGLGE